LVFHSIRIGFGSDERRLQLAGRGSQFYSLPDDYPDIHIYEDSYPNRHSDGYRYTNRNSDGIPHPYAATHLAAGFHALDNTIAHD
jgi:hypothetical protein